jgi:hypothetical protein
LIETGGLFSSSKK